MNPGISVSFRTGFSNPLLFKSLWLVYLDNIGGLSTFLYNFISESLPFYFSIILGHDNLELPLTLSTIIFTSLWGEPRVDIAVLLDLMSCSFIFYSFSMFLNLLLEGICVPLKCWFLLESLGLLVSMLLLSTLCVYKTNCLC